MRALVAVVLVACTASSTHLADRTDCLGCHTTALTDPPPAACTPRDHTNDPTTCSNCHGTVAWCPADAAHTKFNLTSASHAGWDCADCHQSITYAPPAIPDPTAIDCTNCHWHDRARVDPFHIGKGDYVYGPRTCLASNCHGGRRQ